MPSYGNAENISRFTREYHPYSIKILNSGCQLKTNHFFGPHINHHHVFQYIVDGKGKLIIEGREYELKKGDLFILPEDVSCYYEADKNDPYFYYWFSFNGNHAGEFLQICNISKYNPVIHLNDKTIEKCFIELFEIMKGLDLKSTYFAYSKAHEIFGLLVSILFDEKKYQEPFLLNSAVKYIDQNFKNKILISDIADKFHIDRSYFYKLFKQTYNLSPKDYISKLKISHAYKLLVSTNMTIEEIADELSLTKVAFIKLFKIKSGHTPTTFRKIGKTTHVPVDTLTQEQKR